MTFLLLCYALPSVAADPPKFKVIYRQDNAVSDGVKTRSNLMINIINHSQGEAQDIAASISVPNPYLPIDMPVFIGTIPDGHQAEILHKAELPDILIASAEPEENIIWRIEYTNSAGERNTVEVKGERGI